MSLPWVEKYRPRSRNDLVGNSAAINGLVYFLESWTPKSKKKAAILVGPAGCGKTSSVYALAEELDYTITEVNASDTRKKSSIQEVLEPATRFTSLGNEGQRRVILMDEVDGLSGRYDRGGLNEFIKVVKNSLFPIIGTANDPESKNIVKLAKTKEVRVFNFSRLSEFEIFELLLSISEKEGVDASEYVLEQIASHANGDIRAAINELESHRSGSSKLQLEERDKMRTLVELFNDLFRAKDYREARKVLSNAPSDYYKLLLFLFDLTVDQCKTPEELAAAYEQLAKADRVYNRIMKSQDWSQLKYFFDFIGPALRIARSNNHFSRIRNLPDIPTSFISRGKAKRINSRAIKLASTVAPKLHISETKFIHEQYPLFEQIILGRSGSEIAASLDLDDDQISSLTKIKSDTDLAMNIEKARTLIGQHRSKQGKSARKNIDPMTSFFDDLDDDHEVERTENVVMQGTKQDDLPAVEASKAIGDDQSPSSEEEVADQEEEKEEGQLSLDDFF